MEESIRQVQDDSESLRCSFCNKSQREVKKLIAGPTVFICDECVDICRDIIGDKEDTSAGDSLFGSLTAEDVKFLDEHCTTGDVEQLRNTLRVYHIRKPTDVLRVALEALSETFVAIKERVIAESKEKEQELQSLIEDAKAAPERIRELQKIRDQAAESIARFSQGSEEI